MSFARQAEAMRENVALRTALVEFLNTDTQLLSFLQMFDGLKSPLEECPLTHLAPVYYLTYYLREQRHVDLAEDADVLGTLGISAKVDSQVVNQLI